MLYRAANTGTTSKPPHSLVILMRCQCWQRDSVTSRRERMLPAPPHRAECQTWALRSVLARKYKHWVHTLSDA